MVNKKQVKFVDKAKLSQCKELIKWYDKLLELIVPLTVIVITVYIFVDSIVRNDLLFYISMIFALGFGVLSLIFVFGMLYHSYKTKSYWWLTFMIISWLMGLTIILAIAFYLVDMRQNFKEGIGIYGS